MQPRSDGQYRVADPGRLSASTEHGQKARRPAVNRCSRTRSASAAAAKAANTSEELVGAESRHVHRAPSRHETTRLPLMRKPRSKLLSACSDREWHAVGKQLRSRVRAAVDVGSGSDPTVSSAIGRRGSSALVSTSQKVSQRLRKPLALRSSGGRRRRRETPGAPLPFAKPRADRHLAALVRRALVHRDGRQHSWRVRRFGTYLRILASSRHLDRIVLTPDRRLVDRSVAARDALSRPPNPVRRDDRCVGPSARSAGSHGVRS
jgi:hypothetical protein